MKSRLLLVAVLFVGLWLWMFGPSRDEVGRAGLPPRGDTAAPRVVLEPADAPELDRGRQPAPAIDAPAAANPPDFTDAEFAEAVWVEGRIVFPAGTPADERVRVRARGRKPRSGVYHSVPVGADGSFRVAFVHRRTSVTLELEGRYLYLEQRLRLKLDALPDEVFLEPRLGGRILARVLPPASLPGALAELGDLELELIGLAWDGGGFGPSSTHRRTLTASEPGLYVADAVPAPRSYTLYGSPENFPPLSYSFEVYAGKWHDPPLQLALGVRVRGRVVDDGGQPVAGASVALASVRGYARTERLSLESGSDGAFSVVFFPGSLTASASRKGFVDSEEFEAQLDVDRDPAEFVLVLGSGHALTGSVHLTDGSPVGGVTLSYRDEGDPLGRFQDAEERTGADGSFRIGGLLDSRYTLRAQGRKRSARGWAWARHLRPGESIRLTLEPGPVLSGWVHDDAGANVTAFQLVASPLERQGIGTLFDYPTTWRPKLEAGRFELTGLPPGAYIVYAQGEGYGPSSGLTVDLAYGAAEVELVLPRGATVVGVVRTADGVPARRAVVWGRTKVELGAGPLEDGNTDVEVTAGDDGSFVLEGIAPGLVTLGARRPDDHSMLYKLELLPGEQRVGFELFLGGRGRLEGRVAAGRMGIADQLIMVRRRVGAGYFQVRSDSAGRFEVPDLEAGDWDVEAPMLGLDEARRAVVRSGKTTHVVLGEPEPESILVLGRVTRAGVPVQRSVILTREERSRSPTTRKTRTDEQGAFELDLPLPGSYVATVMNFSERASYSVEIPDRAEVSLEFDLPVGRIAGSIVPWDGADLDSVGIHLTRVGGAADGFVEPRWTKLLVGAAARLGSTPPADGAPVPFEFEAVPPGAYRVHVVLENRRLLAAAESIELTDEGQQQELLLQLEPPGIVRGGVFDPRGLPVKDAYVWLVDERGRLALPWPDATHHYARYEFGAVPGRYRIKANVGDRWGEAEVVITRDAPAEVDVVVPD